MSQSPSVLPMLVRQQKLLPDAKLVYEIEKIANGENIHRINNLMAMYLGRIEVYNQDIHALILPVVEIELKLQAFLSDARLRMIYKVRYQLVETRAE